MDRIVFTVLLVEKKQSCDGKQLGLEIEGGSKVVGKILLLGWLCFRVKVESCPFPENDASEF